MRIFEGICTTFPYYYCCFYSLHLQCSMSPVWFLFQLWLCSPKKCIWLLYTTVCTYIQTTLLCLKCQSQQNYTNVPAKSSTFLIRYILTHIFYYFYLSKRVHSVLLLWYFFSFTQISILLFKYLNTWMVLPPLLLHCCSDHFHSLWH